MRTTSGISISRHERRAPKKRSAPPTAVKFTHPAWGRTWVRTATSKSTYANMKTSFFGILEGLPESGKHIPAEKRYSFILGVAGLKVNQKRSTGPTKISILGKTAY